MNVMRNVKAKKNIIPKIHALALALMAKATQWLRICRTWMEEWKKDTKTDEMKDGGKVPETVEEFIDATNRQRRWICLRAILACAMVLNVDVIAWEWRAG